MLLSYRVSSILQAVFIYFNKKMLIKFYGGAKLGYKVKLQKINRPTNKSFFVSIPVVLVESMELEKGEIFEWVIEDKNSILLKRVKQKNS